jgi:hypothetical protein
MLRESFAAGARNVFVGLTRNSGARFQGRPTTNSATFSTSFGSVSAPHWVRLVRQTNVLAAYRSADGSSWTLLGTTNIPMGRTLYAGLAVSAANDNLATAVFTNIQVIQSGSMTDSDGDGMPDNYELTHGFDPDDPVDAIQDADGDGLTNLQEFFAGTDPREAASVLRITQLERSSDDVIIRFLAATGRTYALERSTSLPPSWATVTNAGPATDSTLSITNAEDATAPRTFFRIRLVP